MMKHTHCTAVLMALSILLPLAHAETIAPKPSNASPISPTAARGLSPEQVSAIRKVGRNVLAAKKSGQDDGEDAVQLSSLRASLDALIAEDLDPKNRASITTEGREGTEQRTIPEKRSHLRDSARNDARALLAQLRNRNETKAARMRGTQEADPRSAGLPIGQQRARLFERWATKLDAAVADGNEDRASQLRELRDQLRATRGSLSEAPATHGTPTLQAMPAGDLPLKNNDAAKE